MPRYTFYNKRTKKEWVDYMTIAEMESYLEKNKHIHQVLQPINIVSGVQGITHKTDGGWNDNLNRIAEAHPNSPLADRYKKRGTKEVKTRELIKKHKEKQVQRHKVYKQNKSASEILHFNRNRKTADGRGAKDGGLPKNR